MRVQIKEQFMCCLLAVILFLTGMCAEVPPADVSFLCAKEASGASITGSVLREGSSYTVLEQVYTIETLRRDNATFLSSNKGRNLIRRFARTVVALLTVVILLDYLFCLGGAGETMFAKTVNSHATIVRYIQQTDGKK